MNSINSSIVPNGKSLNTQILNSSHSQNQAMLKSSHTKSSSQIILAREKKITVGLLSNCSLEPKKANKQNVFEKPINEVKNLTQKCKDCLNSTKPKSYGEVSGSPKKKIYILDSIPETHIGSKCDNRLLTSGVDKNKGQNSSDCPRNEADIKEDQLTKNSLYKQKVGILKPGKEVKNDLKFIKYKESKKFSKDFISSPNQRRIKIENLNEKETDLKIVQNSCQNSLRNRRPSKGKTKLPKKVRKNNIKSANSKNHRESPLNYSELPKKKVKFLNSVVVIDSSQDDERSLINDSFSENSHLAVDEEWINIAQNKNFEYNSEYVEEFKLKIKKSNERLQNLLNRSEKSEESTSTFREESSLCDGSWIKNSGKRGQSFELSCKERNKRGGITDLLVYTSFSKGKT